MKAVHGRISVMQEQRFRLTTDTGQSLLFTLAHDAHVDVADVNRFRIAQMPVVVKYEGEPGLASAVARRVNPIS
jgi:hypothetical protein